MLILLTLLLINFITVSIPKTFSYNWGRDRGVNTSSFEEWKGFDMSKDKNLEQKPDETEDQTTTRQRIMNVALEVFAENGVRGATMVEIAKRVGITSGALYWYFENKEEIFDAVVKSHSQPVVILDTVKIMIPKMEPEMTIMLILQGTLAYFRVNLDFLRLVVSEALRDQNASSPFLEGMLEPVRGFMRDCLEIWYEKGLVKPDIDLGSAAQMFLGMVGYFFAEKAVMGNMEGIDKEIELFMEQVPKVFLDGIMVEQ